MPTFRWWRRAASTATLLASPALAAAQVVAAPSPADTARPHRAFFEFEVDAVVRQRDVARLRYPDSLRQAGVQGTVLAQFVVDTAGRPEPGTLRILRAAHTEFADEVRRAVPLLRYHPATVKGRPVRQLVQQPFEFRLEP